MSAAPNISIQRYRWAGPDGAENGVLLIQQSKRLFIPAMSLRAFGDFAHDTADLYEQQEETA